MWHFQLWLCPADLALPYLNKIRNGEVVQLYVSDRESSVERPVKELKGFEKVYLQPGETATVKFELTPRDLSFFDVESHGWKAEKGEFDILVGSASDDIRSVSTVTL